MKHLLTILFLLCATCIFATVNANPNHIEAASAAHAVANDTSRVNVFIFRL